MMSRNAISSRAPKQPQKPMIKRIAPRIMIAIDGFVNKLLKFINAWKKSPNSTPSYLTLL
jgi:hypothetical protein